MTDAQREYYYSRRGEWVRASTRAAAEFRAGLERGKVRVVEGEKEEVYRP